MSSDSPAVIIFDGYGNPVGVVLDNGFYRLQVEAVVTDGYGNTLNVPTNPARIDPVGQTVQPITGLVVSIGPTSEGGFTETNPILIGGKDIDGNLFSPRIDGYGTVSVSTRNSSQTTVTMIVSTTSNTTILLANESRTGATLFNNSTSIIYVKLGAVASSSNFTLIIGASGYYEVPFNYTGKIDAVWQSINGSMLVTEFVS